MKVSKLLNRNESRQNTERMCDLRWSAVRSNQQLVVIGGKLSEDAVTT